MYRYNVDHTVTYTPDDLVLFRESPFAVWMERLTLENPAHGIPADRDSHEPANESERRDDIVATLRAEGRNVVLIDWDLDEPDRRTATLAAMRGGADFIVNGQLAVDTQSGKVNLLMRTSGYSDLGDFLYIPCETRSANTFQAAFRLSFTADLLQRVQGQLPPQMLIIRDGAEVVPLQTEDYIYYYRAVLQRFMHAMQGFRKHRMPDPAESSHFGRWSECANEVLRQRALGELQRSEELLSDEEQESPEPEEIVEEVPQLRVASGAGAARPHHDQQYEVNAMGRSGMAHGNPVRSAFLETTTAYRGTGGPTLAEQARLLAPDSFRKGVAPGHTPNLARFQRPAATTAPTDNHETQQQRRSSDAALQNLEFIGSSTTETSFEREFPPLTEVGTRPAPAPSLRETPNPQDRVSEPAIISNPSGLPDLEPRAPMFLPPDRNPVVEPPHERLKLEPLSGDGSKSAASSVIDLDRAPPPSLVPVVQRAEAEFARIGLKDPVFRRDQPRPKPEENSPAVIPFSNSLNTSQEFNDC